MRKWQLGCLSPPSQWRTLHLAAEHAVEVGEIVEARVLGDIGDRFLRAGEFATGVGDADFG